MVGGVSAIRPQVQWRWLFGPRVDTCFFMVPIFIGILGYLCTQNPAFFQSVLFSVIVTDSFEAGPFHQGPTWFAYADKRNREHFFNDKVRRRIFLWAPPLIILASVGVYLAVRELLILVWMLWAIQHFIQQNIGILLLYHNQNQGEAIVNRTIETRSQWASCLFFFGIFWQRVMLKGEINIIAQIWIYTALVCAIYFCSQYVLDLNKQIKAGAYLNAPATLFWVFSILAFVPFAFLGSSFFDAYMIPTTVHFFQYIGLNFVMAKNKYQTEHIKDLPWQKPLLLLATVCCLSVVLNLSFGYVSKSSAVPHLVQDIARGALLGVALCHFFLDAFIWRFRDQFQRQNILPYLKVRST